MANPTTNFGWVMPTSASLVTNLPADFNTFGQAVDTSMAQLKGGTTGQILSKTSATDMAFTWITNDVGDITAVTAGTGISGGGTSGAVTITNSMATAITTAGDTLYGTGSGTFSRLGIGSTGQVLTVASGVPSWATPASSTPTFVGCKLTAGTQTLASGTYTALTWNGETFDTDGFHSTVTNTSRITIPAGKAGKYQFSALADFDNNTTGSRQLVIRKNGTTDEYANLITASAIYPSSEINGILDLAVADYVEIMAFQSSGSSQSIYLTKPNGNFSCTYLGA